MNSDKKNEELLRECSALGDQEGVIALLDAGVDINSQHSINGRTALQWAARRGHTSIVRLLLSRGADASIMCANKEFALSLASDEETRSILSGSSDCSSEYKAKTPLPITPNYLSNPALAPKIHKKEGRLCEEWPSNSLSDDSKRKYEEELVLKVRIAESFDEDFIEIEVPSNELTYENVFRICCEELDVERKDILKLRKLPNTEVRKDKDVQRFQNLQELELVLKAPAHTSKECQPRLSQGTNRNISNDNGSETNPPLLKKSTFCKNGTIVY